MFTTLGYGYYRWPEGMKANTDYVIEFYDFNGSKVQDFTMTMYAAKQAVPIQY